MSICQLMTLCSFIGSFTFGSALAYALMGNEFYNDNVKIIPMDPACIRSLTSWTADQSTLPEGDWVCLFCKKIVKLMFSIAILLLEAGTMVFVVYFVHMALFLFVVGVFKPS